MSEIRQPDKVFLRRLPDNQGKKLGKSRKFELFQARQWALQWQPGAKNFIPKPPLQGNARKYYWETTYRLRIDGKWLGDTGLYVFLGLDEIAEIMMMGEPGHLL